MDRKEIYVKESLKLFLKFGVRGVTVGQITTRLNVSSKTLYKLFADKQDLVQACFALYNQNSSRDIDRILTEADNVAEALVRFYIRAVESISKVNPGFFNDIARYFPEVWDSDEVFGIHHTRQLLERGVEEGIFVSNIDIGICAETLTLLLRSILEKEVFTARSQALLANVIWPYLRGLCTPAGLEEFRKHRKFAVAG